MEEGSRCLIDSGLWNFNAKVGQVLDQTKVGVWGVPCVNGNGERLISVFVEELTWLIDITGYNSLIDHR